MVIYGQCKVDGGFSLMETRIVHELGELSVVALRVVSAVSLFVSSVALLHI